MFQGNRRNFSGLCLGFVVADIGLPQDFEERKRLHALAVVVMEVDSRVIEKGDR